jgi:type IV pilus assembly protein PilM
MAKSKGVWGIDIGQTAFKALRCHVDDEGKVVADSCDYIEYPKALSLPDADEEALVNEALETFLRRNDLRGDFVTMTVPGQSGLSRFFKPPPVDSRTLPDIVKYEVRQQIPFPIEDVIWDWQSMGGTEMDNVIVDAEVGLFAIKRDTVYTALQPFLKKDLEVDLVQLAPLATQNVVCYELLEDLPVGEEIDMDSLPDSLVILSMGTDATDLIITNGVKLWLRNIPIGGNHFTKELSRELKLTHAKAEHLKRNARQAEDPKTVFQAMRRVFNDLKKEIDRSLSYYSGMDKNAHLDRIVLMGNAARLPGLRQYLNKQLEMDIAKITEFKRLQGPVTEERVFRENILSFAPAYGLCLQGLEKARVNTNLLPVEFVNERIIRAKKPWVLASVSLLLLGMLFSYFFVNQRWWGVAEEYSREGVAWKQAAAAVTAKARDSQEYRDQDEQQATQLERINAISAELSEASETQGAWPELLSAIDQLLPRDPRFYNEDGTLQMIADPEKVPFVDREEIYVDHIETKYNDDVTSWLESTLPAFRYQQGEISEMASGQPVKGVKVEYEVTGEGFIVELKGHHFHNSPEKRRQSIHGIDFVSKRLLAGLIDGNITLLNSQGEPTEYKPVDIGLYNPTLVAESKWQEVRIPNPNFGREGQQRSEEGNRGGDGRGESGNRGQSRGNGRRGGGSDAGSGSDSGSDGENGEQEVKEFFTVPRYDFVVQMIFIPTSPAERDRNREERLKQEAEAAAEAARQAGNGAGNAGAGGNGQAAPATTTTPPAGQNPAAGDSPAAETPPANPDQPAGTPPGESGDPQPPEAPPAADDKSDDKDSGEGGGGSGG